MEEILHTHGNWYKGNLHMHTTRSDGCLSPEEAVRVYRDAGYDFIALTDHWVQNETKQEDGFLIFSGCELDTGDMVHFPIFHIIGVGMKAEIGLERSLSRPPQEIIDAVRRAGGIAILAHPAWSVTDPAEAAGLKGLSGAEVYNSVSGLPWNGERADSSLYFDLWASQGKLFRCMAADDSHLYKGEQTRSFLMVNAEELSADSIRKAIRDGSFYASQGPKFRSVTMDGGTVRVSCSRVQTIVFYSNTIWCADRVATGGVDGASYRVQPTDRYVRVELIDAAGKKAWCSPFPVNRGEQSC